MSPRDPSSTAPKLLLDRGRDVPVEDKHPRIMGTDGLNEALINEVVVELRRYYRIRLFLRIRANEKSLMEIVSKYTDLDINEFLRRYVEEGDSVFEAFSFSNDEDNSDIDDFKSKLQSLGKHMRRFEDVHDLDLDFDDEQVAVEAIMEDLDEAVNMDDPMDVLRDVNEIVCHRIATLLQVPTVPLLRLPNSAEPSPIEGVDYDPTDRIGRNDHAYIDGGLVMLVSGRGAQAFWEEVRFSGIDDLFSGTEESQPIGPFYVIHAPQLSYALSAPTFGASEQGGFGGNFHGFYNLPLDERSRLVIPPDHSSPDISFGGKIFALIGHNTDGRAVTFWMEL